VSKKTTPIAKTEMADNFPNIDQLLHNVGEAVYAWDMVSNEMTWRSGALEILGHDDLSALSTGKAFDICLDPRFAGHRSRLAEDAKRTGAAVTWEYRITLGDGTEAWVEDRMVWCPDPQNPSSGIINGLIRRITERRDREIRLAYLASNDELTGHLNRTRLRERLAHSLAYSLRHETPAGYLVAGIDNLNLINEAYGFDVADEVIVMIAQRLQSVMREEDDIGRVAGNKFGLIIDNCNEESMFQAAERFIGVVHDEVFVTQAGPVSATISVGGVLLPGNAKTTHDTMCFAEEALDLAKHKGRNCFVPYRPSFEVIVARKRNIAIAEQIVRALNENRIHLAYQPIVHSGSKIPALYECLVRMVRRDETLIPAAEFIPVAEKLGLVRLLDRRVSEMAIETLSNDPQAHLSLNVSGATATDTSWLRNFLDLIRANQGVAERLTVEITETIAIRDMEDSVRFVTTLRDLGCSVAIDDFGAGYTSFENLKHLPIDMVKIDGNYVRNVDTNPDNQFFVRTLLTLAKNFNIETVAEMVERPEEIAFLDALEVDYYQGYFYGKPDLKTPAEQRKMLQIKSTKLSTG